jgi:hypothetical protein
MPFNPDAKEGVMRSTSARMRLENLETRALLTTRADFVFASSQVVSDKVGTVDVSVQLFSNDASALTAETVTITTNGLIRFPVNSCVEARSRRRIPRFQVESGRRN